MKNGFYAFISYVNEDIEKITDLKNQLEEQGIDVWFDKEKILPGDNIRIECEEGITDADIYLLCVSRTALEKTSDFQAEIRCAVREMERRPQSQPFFIIVVLDDLEKQKINEILTITSTKDIHYCKLADSEEKEKLFETIVRKKTADKPPVSGLSDIFHMVKETYIKDIYKYRADHIDDPSMYKKYSRLFSFIIRNAEDIGRPDEIFSSLFEKIDKCNEFYPLIIQGIQGYGKSSFLKLLFFYMWNEYAKTGFPTIPFYIDLGHYEEKIYNEKSSLQEQAEKTLLRDFDPFMSVINSNPDKKVIFIIDGVDEGSPVKIELHDYVNNMIKKIKNSKKIIGLRPNREPGEPAVSVFKDVKMKIELHDLPAKDHRVEEFIRIFCITNENENCDTSISCLQDKIDTFGLKSIDLFTISILYEKKDGELLQKAGTISEFYRNYCTEKIIENPDSNRNLNPTARLAFMDYREPRAIPGSDIYKNLTGWKLIHSHPSIRDYLIAYHIINTIWNYTDSGDDSTLNDLNQVPPSIINVFCKEIINENDKTRRDTLKAIEKIIDRDCIDISGRTHLCYLLGRFNDKTYKEHARRLLVELDRKYDSEFRKKPDINLKEKINRKHLLLMRTISISLIILGDKAMSDSYIKDLIKKKEWDDLNRGFYLEYYDDLDVLDLDDMLHVDNGKTDFPNTYAKLLSSLESSLLTGDKHNTFDIELYTLCCLAQQRHINGLLPDEKREKILEIVERVRQKVPFTSRLLKDFLRTIYINFRKSELGAGTFIYDLYSIKTMKRRGWNLKKKGRKVDLPESVADHIYGAYLIGLLYLPDPCPYEKEKYKKYCKDTILKMLLVHDLAEAYTTDLTPGEKHQDKQKIEENCMKYISLLGNYQGIPNLIRIQKIWTDYQKKNSINAEIAHEIDVMENLIQLYIYKANGKNRIPDFEDWEDRLNGAVSTDIGLDILAIIKSLGERILKDAGSISILEKKEDLELFNSF